MPGGRPPLYSKLLADEFLSRLVERSMRDVCSDEDMPSTSTVALWLADNREFQERYARVCEVRSHLSLEEIQEIADDGRNDWMERQGRDGQSLGWVVNGEAVARSRLRVDQRFRTAEKMNPKTYGNRLNVEHSGSITLTDMSDEDLVAEMLELLTKGVVQPPAGAEVEVLDEPDAEDFSDLA